MSSAQFIHSNNQSLLWKVINNTPQTINYFANAPSGEKERWFQSVIGHVYNQTSGQNLSLRDMNKKAIDFMLQSLAPTKVPTKVPSVPSTQLLPAQVEPYKNREQHLTDQFTRRQAEYETMIKKDTPVPHFIENVKDEAILDLGSAVKEYMKQRNQDNEVNLPPPPLQSASPSLSPSSSSSSSPSLSPSQSVTQSASPSSPLKFNLQNAEPISLTIDELPPKKVQWGENTEHVFDKSESIHYNRFEKDILEIKSKLDEIFALLQK